MELHTDYVLGCLDIASSSFTVPKPVTELLRSGFFLVYADDEVVVDKDWLFRSLRLVDIRITFIPPV